MRTICERSHGLVAARNLELMGVCVCGVTTPSPTPWGKEREGGKGDGAGDGRGREMKREEVDRGMHTHPFPKLSPGLLLC